MSGLKRIPMWRRLRCALWGLRPYACRGRSRRIDRLRRSRHHPDLSSGLVGLTGLLRCPVPSGVWIQ
jgi:hypothetical protein